MRYNQVQTEQEYKRMRYQHFSIQNMAIVNALILLVVGVAVYLF
jgi:hypothetical protein